MKEFTDAALTLLAIIMWLAGISLAKGVWMKVFAIFPLFAWYIVVDTLLHHWGIT